MKKLCLIWLACGLASMSSAQEPSPSPSLPAGPWLNKAPDFAQWTIISKTDPTPEDTEPAGDQPSASPSPTLTPRRKSKAAESTGKKPAPPLEQTTVVTKTQSLRHEETSTGKGPKVEKWCVPDMQVTTDGTAAPVVSLPSGAADSGYVDFARTDFPGFEWINEHHFTGSKKVMGQDCWIFRVEPPVKKKEKGSAPEAPVTAVAAINSATRLPVSLQVGDEIQTYEFGLAPTAMIALPPEVETVVEQWRKTMSQSALMPAKP